MGDCNVCISGYDGDGEFCKIVQRKARKPHTCSECGKIISIGDKYEHATGKSDGYMWAFDTCLICAEIAETFYCDGRLFGGMLWEEMEEVAFEDMTTGCLGMLSTGCLGMLSTAAAKQELVRRWSEWKFGTKRTT